ncbi:MAG: GntR family transcriptional regulator [Bifidobacterium sp.]|jgi:GntR family transcriptional regulator|nr:GntR family transcriptional regulator [Bifidobacterium sp.]
MLQDDTRIPMYAQLKATLLADITSGRYTAGSRIPAEPALCEAYGVSRITVRKAINELVEDGYLLKKQGKGTFVRRHVIDRKIEYVMGFTESLEKAGYRASSEVLERRTIPADKRLAEQLDVGCGDDVLYIQRLRKGDGMPVMLENNYFPADRFGFLEDADLTGSLYRLLSERHGIRPINPKTTTLSLALANADLAGRMHVVVGTPFFEIRTLICDQDDRPVHVGHQFYLGELYTFTL